ncbi:hypothetical protein DFQ14_102368 [Halopolyspora algeriensis]|uniref:MFS transporter n=1 Tax=Halopolyspora algeriensis TaxID=1500506 RepID=A0A368VVF1_9ACTN|nr:hypothetical protein DFQ14_102368 [Halopolyspora algeriensis]
MCIAAARPQARRWVALVFIALAQLRVALDATIVTIALPSAQADLNIAAADRHWVITAYTLAFGGLVLFGGRVADQTAGILTTAAVLAAVLVNANKPVDANDGSGSPDCRQSEP